MTRVTRCTAQTPGAVAILQLHGEGAMEVLQTITGREHWPARRALRCDFAGIDEGLAVVLNGEAAQLMPHGGPRVVQKLIAHLTGDLGCAYDPEPDTLGLYPEADSLIEADALDAIARAASPAAIDLLTEQPRLWRSLLHQAGELTQAQQEQIARRSRVLDRLINPPTVVVIGPANVGKSTLTNALMGQAVSIVADLPGTTRDWVGGLVELGTGRDTRAAIAVHWLDTPGLRDSCDTVEQRAIQIARQQIDRADVVIAMRDPEKGWPEANGLPREPDLWVLNKVDDASAAGSDAGLSESAPLSLSAERGINLDALQSAVIHRLGLDAIAPEPWAFSPALRGWCEGGAPLPTAYLG